VILWDVQDSTRPQRIGQPLTGDEDLSSVAFAPDGHILATANSDNTVVLWDVRDPTRPQRIGQPCPATQASFADVGRVYVVEPEMMVVDDKSAVVST
jgi:WD40 repeat protein